MKLLLTSQGFSNHKIICTLEKLLDKPISESTIVVISTASLYSEVNKTWWVDVMTNVRNMNPTYLDIVDILAVEESNWLPRVMNADVLFFTGDNAVHLMRGLDQSGLGARLSELARNTIIVGNSAGNAVLGPDLAASNETKREEYAQLHNWNEPTHAYGLYDFYVTSHFNSLKHDRGEKYVNTLASTLDKTLYAISDQNAIVVIDGLVQEIVGDDDYKIVKK